MGVLKSTGSLRVEVHESFQSIEPDLLGQWGLLEQSAASPNIFLSLDFLQCLFRWVETDRTPVIGVVIDEQGGVNRLKGVGVFLQSGDKASGPKLVSLRSRYVFNSGVLIDKDGYVETFVALVNHMVRYSSTSTLEICLAEKEIYSSDIQSSLRRHGIYALSVRRTQRRVLFPTSAGEIYLESVLSKSRKKDIRRKLNQLGKLGRVSWRYIPANEVTDLVIDCFLVLEHSGWKGDKGTSLLSCPKSESFFRHLVRELVQRDSVFFTVLELSGKTIASTCNFVSGNQGFAFKLGWDAQYAKYSVGLLNEYFIVKQAPQTLANLKMIDSGAQVDSFLNSLWKNQIDLVDCVYTMSIITYWRYWLIKKIRRWRKDWFAARRIIRKLDFRVRIVRAFAKK